MEKIEVLPTSVYNCNSYFTMRLKKEARQVKQKFFKFNIIEIANMHKKYGRQDRDPGWLGHRLAR